MAASAGSVTTTNETRLYDDVAGCKSFSVSVTSGSTSDGLVNIPGLHEAGEYFPIAKGKDYVFTHGVIGIKRVYAKGSGGAATFNFGVVAR